MRFLPDEIETGIIVIVYLVGVGVELAPTFQAKWTTGTPAELFDATMHELPAAFSWPVKQYHRFMDAPSQGDAAQKS